MKVFFMAEFFGCSFGILRQSFGKMILFPKKTKRKGGLFPNKLRMIPVKTCQKIAKPVILFTLDGGMVFLFYLRSTNYKKITLWQELQKESLVDSQEK